MDGIVFKIKGESLMTKRIRTFFVMLLLSTAFWWMFEIFNLFIKNWEYKGSLSLWVNIIGMNWAFATIGPGMLETRDFLEAIGAFNLRTRKFKIHKNILYSLIVIGAACLVSIFVVPLHIAKYLGIPLWVGFIFFLDPINYFRGRRSIFKEWEEGNFQNFLCLFIGGLICGILWEFWNYWAIGKWIYTVPYLSSPKIFEMSLFGYLGFPALALEYYVLYSITLNWRKNQ